MESILIPKEILPYLRVYARHAILISESWLKHSLPSALVNLENYCLLRNDRIGKRGGGVAMYVRKDLTPKIILQSPGEYASRPEFLFLEIHVSLQKCLLGVVYKPPNVSQITDIETALLNLLPLYENVVIMGDFNINLLATNSHSTVHLLNMFQSCNMSVLTSEPTHHTTYSDTLLDIIVTNNPQKVIKHGQIEAPGISAHDIIYLEYSLQCPKLKPRLVTFRDMKHLNQIELTEDAVKLPWQDIWTLKTIDEKVETFNELILQLYNKHAPLKTRRIARPPAPWLTDSVRSLMTERDTVYRKYRRSKDFKDLQEYKRLRNRTNQSIRNAKLRYAHNIIQPSLNPSEMWRNLEAMGLRQNKPQVETADIPLDTLNKYFTSFSLENNDPQTKRDTITKLISTACPDRDKFFFSYITPDDVKKSILRIKSKAQGVDNITITLLHKLIDVILPTVTHIFNASIMTGTYPQLWKMALVRPLPKTKSPTVPSDFRPISILPCLSKALEHIVHRQLTDYLHTHNLLDENQSGFRKGFSTCTALLKVTEDIREAMDRSELTALVLLDFSKAFDTVDLDLLLTKLKTLHLSESCLTWFNSYLRNRQQSVSVQNRFSSWRFTRSGVPQGSVLGPLLFSIYINDISTTLRHCRHHLYADDLQIYIHFRPNAIKENIDRINLDLASISSWSRIFGLRLNAEKTQSIIIGHSRLLSTIHDSNTPSIMVDTTPIPYSPVVKNDLIRVHKKEGPYFRQIRSSGVF